MLSSADEPLPEERREMSPEDVAELDRLCDEAKEEARKGLLVPAAYLDETGKLRVAYD